MPPAPDAPTLGRALAAAALLALPGALLLRAGLSPPRPQPAPPPSLAVRPSLAVLPFADLAGGTESGWLRTALPELLSAELSASGALRVVPGEQVARVRADLEVPAADSLAADVLARIGSALGVEVVVLGAYLAGAEGRVRLDVRVQDVRTAEIVALVTEEGSQTALPDLVARSGRQLREALGMAEFSAADARGWRASLPTSLAAMRPLAEGLARLRQFDAAGARERLEVAVAAAPDHPLAHAALAEAWTLLGHDHEARASILRALELSAGLPREARLRIAARQREAVGDWAEAVRIYDVLFSFFPDNIEHGLRLAVAQTAAGRSEDAQRTIALLRGLPSPSAEDPRLDLAEAALAETRSDFRGQLAAAGRAIARGQARGERLLVARGRLHEAYAAGRLGRLEQSRAAGEEARRIFESAGDRAGLAWALNRAGGRLLQAGHTLDARRLYGQALELFEAIGYRAGVAAAASNLHLLLVLRGELLEAAPWQARARAADQALGNRRGLAFDAGNHALWLHERGQLAKARVAQEESIIGLLALGERGSGAVIEQRAADTLAVLGRLDEAESRYRNALGALREHGLERYAAQALSGLGEVLRQRGDLPQARAVVEEAQQVRRRVGDQLGEAQGRLLLARLALDDGRVAEAEGQLEPALRYFRREQIADGEVQARALQALLAASRGIEAAGEVKARAEELTPRVVASEVPRVAARVLLDLASAQRRVGLESAASLHAAAELTTGMPGLGLEVRLETMLAAGGPGRREVLEQVEREAEDRGLLLLARQAAHARKEGDGR